MKITCDVEGSIDGSWITVQGIIFTIFPVDLNIENLAMTWFALKYVIFCQTKIEVTRVQQNQGLVSLNISISKCFLLG